jgi:hypothetical protein
MVYNIICEQSSAREAVNTNLGFLGMGADVEVEASALDLKEYAVVLVRLVGEDKVALCSSSSESGSGAARFFPLRSFVGSVIETDGADEEGNVALRALPLGRQYLRRGEFVMRTSCSLV